MDFYYFKFSRNICIAILNISVFFAIVLLFDKKTIDVYFY